MPLRLAGDHPRPSRRLRLGALGLALAAHAAMLYAFALEPADDRAGGRGQQLDAINVTIVDSTVLESREAARAQPPAPAAADAVEANDGAAESTPAPPEQKKETAEEQRSQDESAPTAAIIAAAPNVQEQHRQEASAAAAAGGVAARGDAASAVMQSTSAAASPGAVREYARYVSQALARTKPKGVGGFGTVKVKLVISPDGGLASVQIAKSSGNKRLDELARAAVQRATLPAPPPGMTTDQLTYEVPYHFR